MKWSHSILWIATNTIFFFFQSKYQKAILAYYLQTVSLKNISCIWSLWGQWHSIHGDIKSSQGAMIAIGVLESTSKESDFLVRVRCYTRTLFGLASMGTTLSNRTILRLGEAMFWGVQEQLLKWLLTVALSCYYELPRFSTSGHVETMP